MFPVRNAAVKSVVLSLLLLLAVPPRAQARDQEAPPAGRIVFADGGELKDIAAIGGSATVRGPIPESLPVVRMEATRDGQLVVLDIGGRSIWFWKGAAQAEECAGRARPSPKGECLACLETAGVRLLQTAGKLIRQLPTELRDVNFYGPTTAEIVALGPEGVVAFPPMKPATRRLLAKPGARSHLFVSPEGSRAVAVFGEKDASRIFSFALDGTGVPRQLGGPGVPLGWSWDSQWVLIQEGLPPDDRGGDEAFRETVDPFVMGVPKDKKKKKKKRKRDDEEERLKNSRACAVKATGGEAKCWNHYAGVAFSPDSRHVLLRKEGRLFIGRIAGVNAERPKLLVESADPGATWIP